MKAIVIADVFRSFGARQVLRGVNASAEKGSVVGLLGRNGEGKTTLFQILLDMLAADRGRTEILGRSPDGSGDMRQFVGYVPERPTFHDFMTIGEALDLRSRFFTRWNRGRAAALSRRLGLDPSTPVRGASKGTLGKLAWVCAAAHDPEVFLLDEPTSGLDALVREDVLGGLIAEIHESGKTILVANHHMEELSGLLDEVWVLAGGRIVDVHDVSALRSGACRLRGRRREGASIPDGLRVLDQSLEGPVADWIVLDRGTADRIAELRLLENIDRSPVPLENIFKHLLAWREGSHV